MNRMYEKCKKLQKKRHESLAGPSTTTSSVIKRKYGKKDYLETMVFSVLMGNLGTSAGLLQRKNQSCALV